MLIALNHNNQLVHASEEKKGGSQYLCPGCGSKVHLKKGQFRMPHFAHYRNADCSVFSEGETEEHIEGKQLLFDWLRASDIPVQMEAYLPHLQQRPDLLCRLPGSIPLAIEFQCSRLDSKRMLERSKGYLDNGYEVLWILGRKLFIQKYITSFQRLCLKEFSTNCIACLGLDVSQRALQFVHHFFYDYKRLAVRMEKRVIPLKRVSLPQFYEGNYHTQRKMSKEIQFLETQGKLYQKQRYRDPEMMKFLKELYIEGDQLISLPIESYLPVENEWLIETLPLRWKYELLRWVEKKEIGTLITEKDIRTKAFFLKKTDRYHYTKSPTIPKEAYERPIFEFMKRLVERGLLAQISVSEKMVCQHPVHFTSEEDKRAQFLSKNKGRQT